MSQKISPQSEEITDVPKDITSIEVTEDVDLKRVMKVVFPVGLITTTTLGLSNAGIATVNGDSLRYVFSKANEYDVSNIAFFTGKTKILNIYRQLQPEKN